jgi:hypothetical protein
VTASLPGTSLTRQISGVAPHANLISYDVCGSDGYCSESALIAAIDQSVADGVDVINLSIVGYGYYSPWNDSVSLAAFEARDAGIFVATALDDDYQIDSATQIGQNVLAGGDLLDLNADASLYVRFGAKPVSYEDADCEDYYSYGTYNSRGTTSRRRDRGSPPSA